jgi:hypothetical protein
MPIQRPEQPEYSDKYRNEVVAVQECPLYVVAWHGSDGKKNICLAITFGKDGPEGAPNVYIMADQEQMTEQLKGANSLIRDAVRRKLAEREELTEDDVPEDLSDID